MDSMNNPQSAFFFFFFIIVWTEQRPSTNVAKTDEISGLWATFVYLLNLLLQCLG